ncbi:Single-stranded DNA-binding protein, mitochondrial [Geodia barretti]|uniref:Single-stranded DNA-binding protein, mitochondrial n=1 Tax=Geodia barretti TaxID=519541 RepID=A0AA35T5J2_GEOBA|nr:Single-stranded DNA-binding protein, mitochondrial [Geodia barretti]
MLLRKFIQPAVATRFLSTTAPLHREKYINRVQLLGRVGRDPEQRGDAYPVVFFPLATAHTIRSSNQDEPVGEEEGSERVITSWHNITIGQPWFRKYVMDYVTRGSRVIIDGSLAYHKSTLPDGSVRVSANVKAKELIILSTPRQDEESRGPRYDDDFHSPPDS